MAVRHAVRHVILARLEIQANLTCARRVSTIIARYKKKSARHFQQNIFVMTVIFSKHSVRKSDFFNTTTVVNKHTYGLPDGKQTP
jgi:hypothetical protein